jgi:transposase
VNFEEDMDRRMLKDPQWEKIASLLPGKPTDKGGRAADNRLFVEAVLYVARTGCPWRDLPAEFGNWHSVYVRFSRWEQYGVWNRVAMVLQSEADLEEVFIDSTIVRAHQHAAGARKKTVRIRRSAARVAD